MAITIKELDKAYKAFTTEHAKVRLVLLSQDQPYPIVCCMAEFNKADHALKSGGLSAQIKNAVKHRLEESVSFRFEGLPNRF